MKLSLVISVFNEEENIKPLIDQINTALVDFEYEVIFVDDGSSDATVDNIREFGDDHYKTLSFRV